jgi:hypothetical protein
MAAIGATSSSRYVAPKDRSSPLASTENGKMGALAGRRYFNCGWQSRGGVSRPGRLGYGRCGILAKLCRPLPNDTQGC